MIDYPVFTMTRDLAADVVERCFVGTDGALAGAGENTLGVCQNTDGAVDVLGAVSVKTGGIVTAGGLVESDASGRAIDKTTGVGAARALGSATAANQYVLCILIPN